MRYERFHTVMIVFHRRYECQKLFKFNNIYMYMLIYDLNISHVSYLELRLIYFPCNVLWIFISISSCSFCKFYRSFILFSCNFTCYLRIRTYYRYYISGTCVLYSTYTKLSYYFLLIIVVCKWHWQIFSNLTHYSIYGRTHTHTFVKIFLAKK